MRTLNFATLTANDIELETAIPFGMALNAWIETATNAGVLGGTSDLSVPAALRALCPEGGSITFDGVIAKGSKVEPRLSKSSTRVNKETGDIEPTRYLVFSYVASTEDGEEVTGKTLFPATAAKTAKPGAAFKLTVTHDKANSRYNSTANF